MNRLIRPTLLALAAAALGSAAQAQLVDQFDVRREGNHAVLQLRFASPIQFQRAITTRSGDLTLITYALVNTTVTAAQGIQGMRLGAAQGLPAMTLSDEPERGDRTRRIVVRTADATRLAVRAGQGNQSIEIVVPGAGPGVARLQQAPIRRAPLPTPEAGAPTAEVTPATLPAAERRFVIVLQSSDSPDAALPARIPRQLQDYDIFTSERIEAGVRRYEILLGHFANRTQAEAVLRQLAGFPQATLMASDAVSAAAGTTEAQAAPAPVPALESMPMPAPAPTPGAIADVPAPVTQASVPIQQPAPAPALPSVAELDAQATALLASAQAATARGDNAAALASLNDLLNLPPNRHTRAAQALAGTARVRSGDPARARIEFETFLQLYPQGPDSDRVRAELAALPAPAAPRSVATPPTETTVTGSASMSYFGGNGQVRSQDFKDSPLAGLPQVAGDPLLSADKAQQLHNDVDLTWRRRDADSDMRFVFRDAYTTNLERSDKSKNRLSALYVDYKSLTGGYGLRLGRQSPTGGGVLGRFDGASANLRLRPRLKLSAVAGEPTDRFFQSRRRFYGAALDADSLLPDFGAGVYAIQQTIDGQIDRRGVGLEMRYFKGGASVFSQFDYDTLIKGLNIATVQATLILDDATVFNALYDRRALTMLALGNALTFEDPANPGVLYSRIADRLATTTVAALRDQIKRITPFITQSQLGVTRPLNKTWQVGASAQLTNTGAIPPVPEVLGFENGRPATGNIYSASAQLIGLNLYSAHDTHVLSTTAIASPDLRGLLLSYNNSSLVWDVWQFEPSLQYYRDRNPAGSTSQRWTPGLRVSYRGWQRWSLESSLTYELGRATRVATDPIDPSVTTTTRESSQRANYALGARYTF